MVKKTISVAFILFFLFSSGTLDAFDKHDHHPLALRTPSNVKSIYVVGTGWTSSPVGEYIGDLTVCYSYQIENNGQWVVIDSKKGLTAFTHEINSDYTNPMFKKGSTLEWITFGSSNCTDQYMESGIETVPWGDLTYFWLNLNTHTRELNGRYSIHPVFNSGSACDAAGTHNGANIMEYEYWGGSNQIWQISQVGGGEWHRIMSDKDGSRAWDIAGYSTANGANLQLYDYWEGDCQLFKLQKAGAGKTRIVARHSMKCVDVAGGNTANHTNIIQWDCWAGASNQMFYIWER